MLEIIYFKHEYFNILYSFLILTLDFSQDIYEK